MELPEEIVLTLDQPQYLVIMATLNETYSIQRECIDRGGEKYYLMYHKNRANTIKRLVKEIEAQVEEQIKIDPAGEGADRAVCEG